jgi:hypothetical protein
VADRGRAMADRHIADRQRRADGLSPRAAPLIALCAIAASRSGTAAQTVDFAELSRAESGPHCLARTLTHLESAVR